MKLFKIALCFFMTLSVSTGTLAEISTINYLNQHINYIGFESIMPNVSTSYGSTKNETDQSEVSFVTNVVGAYKISLDTDKITLGVTLPSSSTNEEVKNSEHSDIYLKTNIGDIELKLNKVMYKGAYVNEGPLNAEDKFYKDYEVDGFNFRMIYYFDTHFNKVLNSPEYAIAERIKQGRSYFGSWSTTIGFDKRKTTLPNLDEKQVATLFDTDSNVNYVNSLDAQTHYANLGYSGLHMITDNTTYHFRISYGAGLQNLSTKSEVGKETDIGNSNQIDFDFGLYYLAAKHHQVGFDIETYTITSEIDKNLIHNRSSQFSLFYKYFL